MLTGKSLKVTVSVGSAEVAALSVPPSGKQFFTKILVEGQTVRVVLNAKNVRKAVAAVKAAGAENMTTIITGKLTLSPTLRLKEAGLVANLKTKKEVPVVDQAEAA